MGAAAILYATLRFLCWELAAFAAAAWVVRKLDVVGVERWLLLLAVQVTIESSVAGFLSFLGWNSPAIYLVAGAIMLLGLPALRSKIEPVPRAWAAIGALAVPLVFLSFRP